ncbi:nucleotide-binding universal stress UspA family protein [Cupriavidus metallidurans]|jgi:nucleotide-binding universal stress UspA family protein|uniref:Universal stress protein, UspA family n=1 Tax=Cupriavidus metallidurans (strain ATCC 43123 / DSM 2839 / NBRC 102507 / CH34) TaxID=266264 RepID=Q1LI08_CUPMC|nr:universal stress protein [Cupriavidus metallidurans]ABF10218.1 universal stress protein, UspA family [Cupriavidus metallidurans CH34]KWW33039.1 putative universal stress protein [Cupriavidus metallidurans]MDE4919696.1 universal stress protein [Cupriavidus metallidurans]QGS28992.1 universal stress protein [Cupriavidus metallidurans]UBM10778.1 universal stress protein [Cupriavidus metallidurans]
MASKAYSKIVVAVDGSSTSDLALQEAIRVAGGSGATILALYVVDNAMVLFDAGYYDPSQIERAFVESGTRALEAASKLLGDAGVKFETQLVTEPAVAGDIAGSINAAASEWGGDLLVIGTHGRRGVRRLVLGSVAEAVIRQSTMPVLLVRGTSSEQ